MEDEEGEKDIGRMRKRGKEREERGEAVRDEEIERERESER